MRKKEFDYYIFIDFSENLIGYNIISNKKMFELLPKLNKLSHYKSLKHKREYLNSMKKLFEKEKINSYLEKMQIKSLRENVDVFVEVSKFVRFHENCIIFISIDDFQYKNFKKIVELANGNKTEIIKESKLKKNSPEYRMSLVIDNPLNLIRRKEK